MKVIATSVRPLDLRQTAKGAGGQPLTNNRPVWPTRPRGDLGQWRLSKEYQRPIKSTASLKYARSRVDGLAASKG